MIVWILILIFHVISQSMYTAENVWWKEEKKSLYVESLMYRLILDAETAIWYTYISDIPSKKMKEVPLTLILLWYWWICLYNLVNREVLKVIHNYLWFISFSHFLFDMCINVYARGFPRFTTWRLLLGAYISWKKINVIAVLDYFREINRVRLLTL